MKRSSFNTAFGNRAGRSGILGAAAAIAALGLSACTWSGDINRDYDMHLAKAGFSELPVSSGEVQALMAQAGTNRLQAAKIGKKTRYVYLDPANCNCAYVGDANAYRKVAAFDQMERERTTLQVHPNL